LFEDNCHQAESSGEHEVCLKNERKTPKGTLNVKAISALMESASNHQSGEK